MTVRVSFAMNGLDAWGDCGRSMVKGRLIAAPSAIQILRGLTISS
jgi:hypothetical protein